jgi:hypothetical protein
VSPVKYELGFYIPEDDVLLGSCLRVRLIPVVDIISRMRNVCMYKCIDM